MTANDHLDIEDDYPEYVDDEGGYAYDAWDTLPAAVIRAHDRVAALSPEALGEVDPAGLSNLERWAYALNARRGGDVETFLEVGRLIAANLDDDEGLDLRELQDALVREMTRAELFDEARLFHQRLSETWPEDAGVALLGAHVAIAEGEDVDATIERVVARWPEDTDLHYEICEELVTLGRDARNWLKRAETLARSQDDRPTLLDLELLKMRQATSLENEG